jgi:transcription-repair coupling factor (superfamily II helicase)
VQKFLDAGGHIGRFTRQAYACFLTPPYRAIDKARRLSDLELAAQNARDRFGALPDAVVRLFRIKAIKLRLRQMNIARIDVGDRRMRLHLAGPLPKELMAVKLPELVHVQPDGAVLVLFLRPELTQDVALGLMCRLLSLDLGFLGRGD